MGEWGVGGREEINKTTTKRGLHHGRSESVEELEALPEGTVSDEGNHTIDSMQVHRGLVSTRDDPVSLRGDQGTDAIHAGASERRKRSA